MSYLSTTATDKLGHYVAGTFVALVGLLLARHPYVASLAPGWAVALALTLGVAIGREVQNAAAGGEFNPRDIGATMLGAAAIAAASLT